MAELLNIKQTGVYSSEMNACFLCFKWFYTAGLERCEKYNCFFDGSSDFISYRAGM